MGVDAAFGRAVTDRANRSVRTYVAAMFDKFLRMDNATVLDQRTSDPDIITAR